MHLGICGIMLLLSSPQISTDGLGTLILTVDQEGGILWLG